MYISSALHDATADKHKKKYFVVIKSVMDDNK